MKKFLFLVSSLLLLIPAYGQSYKTYCNSRYGQCVSYHTDMGIKPAPENHDGRVFYNDEGFNYRVSGSYNALGQTNYEVFQEYRSFFDKVTYQVLKKQWFTLSGYKGNEIIYIKCYIGKEYTYTLLIRYPIKDKEIYDETLSHIVKSFRPGPLS